MRASRMKQVRDALFTPKGAFIYFAIGYALILAAMVWVFYFHTTITVP